jgi:RNA polymerase sigma-70 factor (ECF subfamily)
MHRVSKSATSDSPEEIKATQPMGLMEEQQLVALVLRIAHQADPSAFALLVIYFTPRVKSYLGRRGASNTQAEDLAQEVLFTVWRKASLFIPGRGRVSVWVFAIARNLWIDTLRREQRAKQRWLEIHYRDADVPPSADAELITSEQTRILREAISELSCKQIEIVRLAFYEGLSHREIEHLLQIPLGTVKARMRATIQQLRSVLENRL